MAWPDTTETEPVRSTTLSGGDGNLSHSAYGAASFAQLKRVGDALIGARGSFATLALRLTALTNATKTIRTVSGTSTAVAIGPAGTPDGFEIGSDTGLSFPADNQIKVWASGQEIVHVTPAAFSVKKVLSTVGTFFVPNIGSTVSGGLFVKWDSTAGEMLKATSERRFKENFRPLLPERALDVVMQLRPTVFDAIDRAVDRPGITVGISGFVAEDLAEVDEPGLAAVDEADTPIGRNDEAILTMTVAAVQHLAARVETLEAR